MRRIITLGAAVVLLAAACGDSADNDAASGSTSPTSSTPPTSAAVEPSTSTITAPDSPATAADGWRATLIGDGTKPDLALNRDDRPAIAFLFEDIPEGFVAFASAADGWTIDPLVEGYFYGPIGLDFDAENRPNIAYHDHQADSFDQQLGDLTHAVRGAGDWQITAAASDGHDGWDSTIRIGPDGVVRAAGVDPAQFGREEGLEYYELTAGEWTVQEVGTGPIEYEWNVDLQVAPDGTVAITYFATDTADLVFASRAPGQSTWTLDTVAADGDVGRFSSFAFDADGVAHISYWNADTSEVVYATNGGGIWTSMPIATLDAVEIGFEGARRVTSLALDPTDRPVIAHADTSGVWLARLADDGGWERDQLVAAGSRPLGQLITLAIDADGTEHLAYFEVTANNPLAGEIYYLTRSE